MLPNAFIGKPKKPTAAELTAALGPAKALWDQLLARLADEFNLTVQEWNSYSRKAGWSLRLKLKDRNILYLTPCQECFYVSFALGDKAVEAARESGLPPLRRPDRDWWRPRCARQPSRCDHPPARTHPPEARAESSLARLG